MKCAICKQEVGIVYLEKVAGTYMKDAKGKKHLVCSSCQAELGNDKKKILGKLE